MSIRESVVAQRGCGSMMRSFYSTGGTILFSIQLKSRTTRRALARLGPTPDARMAKTGTEREKDYLRAIEALYGEGAKASRDFAFADAMAELHQKYASDVDGAAFYALALLGTAHEGRDFAIYMRAAAILEPLFPSNPNHPGIAHYLIHSYDDPTHVATRWHLASRHRAPWKGIPPPGLTA
jgi:hypothetical protein